MIRYRYNKVPHLTQDTISEIDKKTKIHHVPESQEVSLIPLVEHKAARNGQDSMTNTNMKHKHKYQKLSTEAVLPLERPGKNMGGLKHF